MTSLILSKFDLRSQFQESSILGPCIYQKVDFSDYHTRSNAYHVFEMVTWLKKIFWYVDLLTYNFCPYMIWKVNLKEFLFEDPLFF